VEFAIILPVLMLLILGGIDISHMYYIEHLITNASREGARYGVKYQVNPSTGLPFVPSALTPSISNYVKLPAPSGLNYSNLLSSDANLTVTPGGEGYTGGLSGQILTVTVTANKHWFVLGGLLGFTNPKTLRCATAMSVER
jgi:Flp pilus assembly protein TadG